MSCSRQAQGYSRTAWDKAKEWIKKIFNRIRRRKSEKTLESKIDEAFQDLSNKMKALHENFKNLESKEREEIREELEMIPENEEEEIARTLEAKLNMRFRELSRKIRTLQEDLEEWPEAIKDEVQLFRAELKKNSENEEEEIARTLEAKLNTRFRELSRKIRTLEADVEEWPEAIKDEVQLFRAELKKNSGNKEEEIAKALEAVLKKTLCQLFQGIQSGEDVNIAIYHETLLAIA
ncbi:uncharacterized protein LOC135287413 [Passer domesticus]|uniref:uncharacterized protein LOC135287413 n=1 Tax=Passer domesticus TaxID=48849 RepID=UPI0030FE71BE